MMSRGKPLAGRVAALGCDDALRKSVRVLMASDVEVPLGQNLETYLNPHQMVYG